LNDIIDKLRTAKSVEEFERLRIKAIQTAQASRQSLQAFLDLQKVTS
jgi:hypothetical protein